MITPLYKCSQQELYSVCRLGWGACSEHLSVFSAHRAIYTPSYIATKLTAIADAEALPGNPVLRGAKKVTRNDLAGFQATCVELFNILMPYIIVAFPNDSATYLDMAGQGYLVDATKRNWVSMEALNKAAKNFIADHLTELTANLNMPATFQQEFKAAADEFELQHGLFLGKGNVKPKQISDKIKKNNEIYLELKEMLEDGKARFQKDKETRQQFVLSRLLYLVGGSGTSGIKGYVVDAATDMPIEGVEISIYKKRNKVMTDSEGHYAFLKVAAGHYEVTFKKAGYVPVVLADFEINVGTTTTLNQIMTALPQDDNEE